MSKNTKMLKMSIISIMIINLSRLWTGVNLSRLWTGVNLSRLWTRVNLSRLWTGVNIKILDEIKHIKHIKI